MAKKNVWSRWWLEVAFRCERASASSRSVSAASAKKQLISLALLLMLLPVWVILIPSPLHAATITVDTTADPGNSSECSLRAAINNANNMTASSNSTCAAGTGNDTIVFSVSGTITLGSDGILKIQNILLTIDGSGHRITVSGDDKYPVFYKSLGALTLNDLTITHGLGDFSAGYGGAVGNDGDTLTVTNCTISHNSTRPSALIEGAGIFNISGTAIVTNSTFADNNAPTGYGFGGAIYNSGDMTVTNSTFSDNYAASAGGGIFNEGTLTVTDSSFSYNGAYGQGGGIYNVGAGMTVTNSTFSDNYAASGGGIYNYWGTVDVTNSTFYFNDAIGFNDPRSHEPGAGEGGGIFNGGLSNRGSLTVTNSTLAFNGAFSGKGGGIENYYLDSTPTVKVSNSIVAAGGAAGLSCGVYRATIDDGGYNISDDTTCGFGSSTGANGATIGDNVNPLLSLSGLANNGGPTETIALEPNSPAIDAIPIALCPATDQRGIPRPDPSVPAETACDIGAFESGYVVVLVPSHFTPRFNFGTLAVGQISPPVPLMLDNQTEADLIISDLSIGPDYQMVSTTCPLSDQGALTPGQFCEVLVSFQPLSAGHKNELFKVFDSASKKPQTIKLQGIATRQD